MSWGYRVCLDINLVSQISKGQGRGQSQPQEVASAARWARRRGGLGVGQQWPSPLSVAHLGQPQSQAFPFPASHPPANVSSGTLALTVSPEGSLLTQPLLVVSKKPRCSFALGSSAV